MRKEKKQARKKKKMEISRSQKKMRKKKTIHAKESKKGIVKRPTEIPLETRTVEVRANRQNTHHAQPGLRNPQLEFKKKLDLDRKQFQKAKNLMRGTQNARRE